MPRRLHATTLRPGGLVELDPAQAHHARHVLRLADGDPVELFDDAGRTADGVVVASAPAGGPVAVRVGDVREPELADRFEWTVAAAVPKGERADWMVEKLSELGCHAFVPLLADRSVVQPKGVGKRDRWVRLATESAKQSRRRGVMRVAEPTRVGDLLAAAGTAGPPATGGRPPAGWFLDTGDTATPVRDLLLAPAPPGRLTLWVGPEGGWSPAEVDRLLGARLTAVALTPTVLRVETAAVAAAACVAAVWAGRRSV